MTAVAERVARGAALLDRECPRWHDRIDCDRLDMSDPRSCLLTQAFRPRKFGDSVAALGLTSRLVEHGLAPTAAGRDDGGMITGAEVWFADLEAAWIAAVAARTGQDASPGGG
jgi:hypothetical protein